MKIVDYTSDQLLAFSRVFYNYWTDVEGREPNEYIEKDGVVTNELQYKLYTYEQENAKIKLAYHEQKLIGFMVYHLILDCILVCRAIYIDPAHRSTSKVRRLIFSAGKIRRGFSVTYADNEPEEVRGEKKNRKFVCQRDGMNVWENIIGDFHGGS